MEGTYNPQKVIVIWGGITFGGFSTDSIIKVTYDENAYTKVVGADGTVARTLNANRCGMITVELKQSSGTNDLLSAAAVADRLGQGVVAPFIIKDTSSGASLVHTEAAWIQKAPDFERGKEMSTVAWVFDTAAMDVFHGA
jgi:hypothetical protein